MSLGVWTSQINTDISLNQATDKLTTVHTRSWKKKPQRIGWILFWKKEQTAKICELEKYQQA
jgi:hypothetical protein